MKSEIVKMYETSNGQRSSNLDDIAAIEFMNVVTSNDITMTLPEARCLYAKMPEIIKGYEKIRDFVEEDGHWPKASGVNAYSGEAGWRENPKDGSFPKSVIGKNIDIITIGVQNRMIVKKFKFDGDDWSVKTCDGLLVGSFSEVVDFYRVVKD